MGTDQMWIVAADVEEYGRIYLADYAGRTESDVADKVMNVARREFGPLKDRLADLGWEIVRVRIEEVE